MPEPSIGAIRHSGKVYATQTPYNVLAAKQGEVQWYSPGQLAFEIKFKNEKSWPFSESFVSSITPDAQGRTSAYTIANSSEGNYEYDLFVKLDNDQDQINPIIIIDPQMNLDHHGVSGNTALVASVAAAVGFVAGYLVGSALG